MEAWRFGFNPSASLPPAFKFDPTDTDIVVYYLLPRALNIPNPHAHDIIDADPASCPPWELLRRHGHADSEHAFFFAPLRKVTKNGGVARASRAVPAGEDGVPGKWRGQKDQVERLFLQHRDGGEIVVKLKKYNLTYYNEGENTGATGWVMHEYQIIDPPLSPGVVLARVKIADKARNEHRKRRKAAAAAQMSVSYPDLLPGPSSDSHHVDGQAAGTSNSAQQVFVVQESDNHGDDDDMGEPPVANYTDSIHSRKGTGGYVDDNDNNYVFENVAAYFNWANDGTGNNNHGDSSNAYDVLS